MKEKFERNKEHRNIGEIKGREVSYDAKERFIEEYLTIHAKAMRARLNYLVSEYGEEEGFKMFEEELNRNSWPLYDNLGGLEPKEENVNVSSMKR